MRKTIEEIELEAKNEIYDALSKGDENIRAQIIKIHEEMQAEHDELFLKITAGQVSGREAASLINESLFSSLKKMAKIVGADTIKEVFEVDVNTDRSPQLLVDPESMEKALSQAGRKTNG